MLLTSIAHPALRKSAAGAPEREGCGRRKKAREEKGRRAGQKETNRGEEKAKATRCEDMIRRESTQAVINPTRE